MTTKVKTFLIALFLCLPFCSLAWGVLGHRIVGQIADSYLTAKAKAEIKKILGNESVAMSSNWADFIKSDTSYRYLNSWHYVNLDKGMNEEQLHQFLHADTATDVYTKMKFLVAELKKKNQSLDKKQMYLRLLIHFVGDIHQPMHTARKEDLGGNRVRVSWFNTPTNLHAVWDESLVNFQQLSYTEYAQAINFTTLKQRKAWQKQPMSDWVIESYKIAETLYADIKEDNQRLGYEYNFKYVATVNDQLLKGGVRLAGVLNDIFK
ncbi:MAG TPA: S1/P1 nuclease [Flavisolibacter sp.]|nr:S1/P1 nuclease [Flavisolibacter sp.]